MESNKPTEEFEPVSTLAPTDLAPTEIHRAPALSTHDRCVACGAPLASDQRYCVECGQRLGRARLPFMDDPIQHMAPAGSQPAARSRGSANTTLLAGIGTLLLAMGVGVLIGRSGQGSAGKGASSPIPVVTVPSTGAAASATGSEVLGASTSSSTTKQEGTKSGKSGKSSSSSATKSSPPAKAVTVGSAGKGPGYQKGHFTGNFFGGEEEGKEGKK